MIPRSDPPQPQIYEMGPQPNFTVPDVSHMYDDSVDSLVWKPGANMVERSKKTSKVECGLVFPLPQNKNKSETIKDNTKHPAINMEPVFEKHSPKIVDQNIRRLESPTTTTSASPTTTASNVNNSNNILEKSEQDRFRLSKDYCPELYCSPKQNLSRPKNEHKVLQSQVISNEINKMKYLAYGPNICSVNNNCDGGIKNIKGSNGECIPQVTSNLHRCECSNNQDLFRNNHQHFHSLPVPNSCHPPILETSCQSHILKVIEKQNQHILYLQNILEKLLQNSLSKDISVSPNCNNCSDLDKSNHTKKDVSTQTSYFEFLPKTKSIGTNTDHELLKKNVPSNNINNVNNCNRNCCQKNECNSQVLQNNVNVNDASKKQRILDHDNQNDYPTHNNNMESVYNSPPSPKPIHMDAHKHNEDEYPDCQECNYGMYRSGACEGIGYSDGPLAGESAIMYNKRYMQNRQQFAINPNSNEIVQEENGVTFFKRVRVYRNETSAAPKMTTAGAFYNGNPTLQQLQHFGISFLDPVTLEDNRKPTPRVFAPFDKFDVVNAKKKGRPANHYPEDSHLAFIAQNAPAMIDAHRAHHVGDKEISTVNDGQNEAYSFATKQFLNRHKLLKSDY